jgi:hypothetical protein
MMKTPLLAILLLTAMLATAQKLTPAFEEFCVRNQSLFLQQTSQFYPISVELLEKYPEEWSALDLSQNTRLPWSAAFIERFEARLELSSLLRNPSIIWDETLIDRYIRHKDFNWFALSQNPSLPLNESFLEKYANEIEWSAMQENPAFKNRKDLKKKFKSRLENQPALDTQKQRLLVNDYVEYKDPWLGVSLEDQIKTLPQELQAIRLKPIKSLDTALLHRYEQIWDWYALSNCTELPWSMELIDRFSSKWMGLNFNAGVYEQVFAPVLSDGNIQTLLTKLFPPDQVKFYVLDAGDDAFGITPGVESERGYFEKLLSSADQQASTPKRCTLGGIWEPPLRFVDVHDWGNDRPLNVNAITVSEKVKTVLERFQLPPHQFLPIDLMFKDLHYGADTQRYYILNITDCDHQLLDYSQAKFYRQVWKDYQYQNETQPSSFGISDAATFTAVQDSLQKLTPAIFLTVRPHVWKAAYDVMVCDQESGIKTIWVSEDVKKALEIAGVVGAGFERVRKTPYRMLGLESAEHRRRNEAILNGLKLEYSAVPPTPTQRSVQKFLAACARRDSILSQKGMVKRAHASLPKPAKGSSAALLREKEAEWEVLLPAKYFQMASTLTYTTRFKLLVKILGYDLTSLENLSQIGDEWHKNHPHMVRGVIFAENGVGDALYFQLKPGSAFELDEVVYELLHETGETRAVGKL